ncbi:MAG: efflux RND transporter permease subunit [Arenicella sp.]|nr:efflux RND transporter permease subunit [Arenicella sp.]
MIAWFAKNPVAANLLMFATIVAGLSAAIRSVPVETFPTRERDIVTVTTQFRGATPKTTEEGITLRIEEAIADIEGIIEITSRSAEGRSVVSAEVASNHDTRDILDDIKVRVDALNTLPRDAEKPVVALSIRNPVVIFVAIKGEVGSKTLRETASAFRLGLLSQDGISNVELQGVANYEMHVEITPQTLDDYNLTLEQVGIAIRQGATDVAAGNVQTRDGDILIRSPGQAYTAPEFSRIPILSNREGKPITLGEIAQITDGFEEKNLITTFDGEPAVMVEVRRVGDQSALQVSAQTKAYMEQFSRQLPSGVSVDYWDDDSEYLQTRISAVLNSAVMGGILVMILLSLFLRPAVAFWVFLGIPISFMGAFLFMPFVGGSFNVISLFAFIMVIGIVVDDAIVTGENIYRKIRNGMEPLQASITGTREIAVPVTFGILTTVAAFIPLNYLQGTRYEFIGSQLPMVVIPVMLMSLVESKLVLPSHMSHIRLRDPNAHLSWLARTQQRISHGLERFVDRHYRPFLARCVNNKSITISSILAVASVIIAMAWLGHTKFQPFPRVESDTVRIYLTMPESTGFATTSQHIADITRHFKTLQEKYRDAESGESVIVNILAKAGSSGRTVKSNVGSVQAALQPSGERVKNVTAHQIAREVRQLIGGIPGAQSLSVRAVFFRDDAPINVEFSGAEPERLYPLALLLKEKLKEYPGVFDIQDNYSGGKEELKLELKPRASSLGLRLNDVARQVRNAVFGFQAQRIQRGRDELRVMVRYPLQYRSSINDLNQLAIRVPNSTEVVSLSEIALVTPVESASTLYRQNRTSILNVTADLDQDLTSVPIVLADLDEYLRELLQNYPDVNFRYDGEAEETAKTNARLQLGAIFVLLAIYVLLAVPLKSYGQPLIVMSIIPLSLVGAMLGHIITGQDLSILSIFGMLALVGVVVNDSLVLVDYINQRRRRGRELLDAVIEAATIRFRPVLLTSLTTFAGLAPILLDGSQQAKWLKPMATSLAFGILFATVITLLIVPVNYLVARNFKHASLSGASRLWQNWLEYWNREDPRQA